MNPVAFQIFGLEIRWYGVVITLGIMVAFIVSYYNLNKDEKKLKLKGWFINLKK